MRSLKSFVLSVSLFLLAATSFAAVNSAPVASPALEGLREAIFAPLPGAQAPQAPQWMAACTASVACPHHGGTITCSGTGGCLETTCVASCLTGSGRVTLHCPSPCIEQ
jgi:hypothetical protein